MTAVDSRPAPRTTSPPRPLRGGGGGSLLPLVAGILYLPVALLAVATTSYDIWGAVVWGPVCVALTAPFVLRRARLDGELALGRLIVWGLVAKLCASVARWFIGAFVYGGLDAFAYLDEGARLAQHYRVFDLGVTPAKGWTSTGFIELVTGLFTVVIGETTLGMFVVFSWLGFLGLYCFYRALRVGLPDASGRRYAVLVLFLPSMLYWPSSVGKDAWMMLALGLASLGVAKVLARQGAGFPTLLVGLLAAAMVRPHMALLVAGAFGAALVFRRGGGGRGLAGKLALLGVMVVVGGAVLGQVQAQFGLEDGEALTSVADEANRRTVQANSVFEAEQVRSAGDLPAATIAVIFRPFPWEAHNLQALATSMEGAVLFGLIALGWRRLARLPRQLFAQPYLVYATVYSLGFIVAFSSFGNFAILARQRTQLLPLLLVLLTGVAVQERTRRRVPR